MKYTETGTNYSHSAGYTYDKLNNLTGLQETINGVTRTTSYFYDDDNRVIGINAAPGCRGFNYDDFGRLTDRTTKHQGTNLITETIGFSGNGTGGTSGQVSSHNFSYGSTGFTYGYAYDDNGNITSILKNGVTVCHYTYDSQNQLIREDNREAGKTWVWAYDGCGNIITRTEYPFTLGELGTETDLVRYQHYDYHWGDLLFRYDGDLITHDDLGNPVDDGTWTYTWEHGRELAAMAENERVTITSQPEDCFCTVGDRCSFSVAAQGNGLTYQWQYSANNGTTWTDSLNVTAVTPTMTIGAAKASQIGLLWRCIITDGEGRTAVSQTGTAVDSAVTRPITVTNQPDDVCCSEGGSVAFSVEAVGNGLTYHWQISTDGSDWSNIYSQTAFTPTYAWNGVPPSSFGNYYRCKITDAEGNVAYSRPARLKRDTTLWEFTYNADGLRTGRTNGESTYAYTYLGTQLTHMTVDGHTLYFTYDAAGTPISVSCDGDFYYYVTNIQGDVIAIVDTTGTEVATYSYDAWGNIISHTGSTSAIGRYNPLTYRGYVYDTETEYYYLQSRYYNPETGRFINADAFISTGQGFNGNNMFAYCLNNPVNNIDTTGKQSKDIWYYHNKMKEDERWYLYVFGAGAYTTHSIKNEKQIIPDPFPITATIGTEETWTMSECGDASKPLSVYAEGSIDNPVVSSSAGIRVNIDDFTLDIGVALDDIGITGSVVSGGKTNSLGLTIDLTSFKAGIQGSTSFSRGNIETTSYWNVSLNGWTIIALYWLVTTGETIPAPSRVLT